MPRRSKSSRDTAGGVVSSEEKIARLLALLLVRDIPSKTDQVPLLRSVGFEIGEISQMLDMTEHHVVVASHVKKKKKRKRS